MFAFADRPHGHSSVLVQDDFYSLKEYQVSVVGFSEVTRDMDWAKIRQDKADGSIYVRRDMSE